MTEFVGGPYDGVDLEIPRDNQHPIIHLGVRCVATLKVKSDHSFYANASYTREETVSGHIYYKFARIIP